MNKNKAILFIVFILVIFCLFKSWFSFSGTLAAGDWLNKFPQAFSSTSFYPYTWDPLSLTKFGENNILQLPLNTYYLGTGYLFTNLLHLSWNSYERIIWFFPFLILSFFPSRYLFKHFFSELPEVYSFISSLIFMTNTYIFMMVGGGQIGVGIAFALVPFAFVSFVKIINTYAIKPFCQSLIAGFLFTLLVFLDLRFAYLTVLAVFFYLLVVIRDVITMKKFSLLIIFLLIPFGITLLLNMFWILPLMLSHQNPAAQLGAAYTSFSSVSYLSFAKFENTIGLLQPYWPENIFGKVSFMKPEFLLLPILAYCSLLFLESKKVSKEARITSFRHSRTIIYFTLLGLIGAFLAKGTNDPFGFVYLWMFNHFPGFIMFRDSTKFYTSIVLSYSILIPYTLWKFSEIDLKIKNQEIRRYIIVGIFTLFWLFTIRQAVFNQLTGTFKPMQVPLEYVSFENYIVQKQFSRTLWVPTTERFGFYSANHPAISAQDFFNNYTPKNLLAKLNKPGVEQLLQEAGVGYVIVPIDSRHEIFLDDRIYSEKAHQQTIVAVSKIPWLKPMRQFGDLAVFEVSGTKDHFWSPDSSLKISTQNIDPTKYEVTVTNAKKGELLVFSESFDPYWTASLDSESTAQESSKVYKKLFNSFSLPKSGNYSLEIYYSPQKWVNVGLWVSLCSLVILIGIVLFTKFRLKRKL